MEVKCEYCGSLIPDDQPKCPNCGAPNMNMQRAVDGTPKTIAELEQWYRDRNLPPYNVTRFFIGIDCKEPRAFGIYKEGEHYIVYKNKADGSRAVRYNGTDEDYAVNELYLKLKEEILKQKAGNQIRRQSGNQSKKPDYRHMDLPKGNHFETSKSLPQRGTARRRSPFGRLIKIIIGIIIAFVLLCMGLAIFSKGNTTYYSYGNVPYMFHNGSYYAWDDGTYEAVDEDDLPDSFLNNIDQYQVDRDKDDYYYYEEPHYYDSGNSYDWDSNDSWDNNAYSWDDNDSWDWDSNDSWDYGGWDSNDSWDYGGWDSDW